MIPEPYDTADDGTFSENWPYESPPYRQPLRPAAALMLVAVIIGAVLAFSLIAAPWLAERIYEVWGTWR